MPSAADILPLWLKLDECTGQLLHLYRLQPNQNRIQHWPGAEMHHVPTLVLCLAGQTRLTYEQNKKMDLQAGEAVLIGPGIFHDHAALRPGCITMQQGLTPSHSDFHLRNKQSYVFGHIPLNRVQHIFHRIINDRHEQQAVWLNDLKGICQSILHEHEETTHNVPRSFHHMFHHFVRHVYEGADTDDIVEASKLSRSRAYKIWSTYYGIPLRESLCQQRLYLAKLLLQTDISIEDIAQRCGFSSRQQMTRLFQHYEKCSPRQWRLR